MARPENVAFVGLGIMGGPMARNLRQAGFELSVYTRTREKAERFAGEHGARAAATPAEAAEGADALITMVPDAPEVEQVLDEALATLPEAALVVDMSTTSPTASRAIAERVAPRDYLEAPVSGSKPGAEAGTLTIFAGGEQPVFDRAQPLLQAMGELIVLVGPLGHGQMAKLLTNAMGAVNAATLAEAVRAAKAAGLDPDAFLEVASRSAGASTMLNLKGRPMFDENFEPALFKLDHMLKDLRHTLHEARALGIELRLPGLAEGFYERASESGHGEEDFGAVYTGVDGGS
jgi:3-hydroxyisobutyrate dehydrogenase-like beta-hydroxyacid dehydrogenase